MRINSLIILIAHQYQLIGFSISFFCYSALLYHFLGYDPAANPPDYGKPDSFVLNNTKSIKQNVEEWRAKENVVEREREALRRKMAMEKNHHKDEQDNAKDR